MTVFLLTPVLGSLCPHWVFPSNVHKTTRNPARLSSSSSIQSFPTASYHALYCVVRIVHGNRWVEPLGAWKMTSYQRECFFSLTFCWKEANRNCRTRNISTRQRHPLLIMSVRDYFDEYIRDPYSFSHSLPWQCRRWDLRYYVPFFLLSPHTIHMWLWPFPLIAIILYFFVNARHPLDEVSLLLEFLLPYRTRTLRRHESQKMRWCRPRSRHKRWLWK